MLLSLCACLSQLLDDDDGDDDDDDDMVFVNTINLSDAFLALRVRCAQPYASSVAPFHLS